MSKRDNYSDNNFGNNPDQSGESETSKTQIKKHMNDLQDMGEELQQLSKGHLAKFNLSENLRNAIAEGNRLKEREALRRHRQLLGRIMREEDEEMVNDIRQKLEDIRNAHQVHTRSFKDLEELRERLINGGNEELGNLIAKFPNVDTQKLRQLIRQAKTEAEKQMPPAASRKLFKFLRELHERSE